MRNLDAFFSAQSIAIIGVSRDTMKVGHIIFRNFIDAEYSGKVFPVNPNATLILNKKAYHSVLQIPEKIDLAIVAVPAEFVPIVVDECGKKKIENLIVITSGFKEMGNYALDKKLLSLIKKYRMNLIGPNCLGTFDSYTKLDSLFLPRYRLKRPKEGGLSFVCQSGAVGSSILDMATKEGYGFAKFISYGNAMDVDESDLIEYLGSDEKTRVICLYLEGIGDGRKFIDIAKKVSKKKPIIAIKAGKTKEGSRATLSHTGSLAGTAEVYSGIFRQTGILEVSSLGDMFETAKMLEKCMQPKGERVMVITNGGGYGILATDATINNGMHLAEISKESKKVMKKLLPAIALENPIDLLGDATTEGYKHALSIAINDKGVDIILLVVLYQTPLVTTDIVDIIIEANDMKKKPIIVVSAGGEFTDVLKSTLEANNIPNYTFPENAVRAIRHLVGYYKK